MSNPSETSRVFLNALSSFWQRLFADRETLVSFYQGSEELLGQAYLDLLESALYAPLKDAPVFHKEYWKLLSLDTANKFTNTAPYIYAWKIATPINSCKLLQNKVIAPDVVLEPGYDFTFWSDVNGAYVGFKSDPTTLAFPTSSTGISVWVVDAYLENANLLYDTYGVLVNQPPTAANYKSLLRGIFQYYALGPALSKIESALNVATGVPVTEREGEVVTSLGAYSVTTDYKMYTLPVAPKASLQVGTVLHAFSSLTDMYAVVDYRQDPSWFCGALLGDYFFENAGTMPPSRKTVDATLRQNVYLDSNAATLDLCYGDPGVFYGADYNGRPTADANTPGVSYKFAYTITNSFLKYHMFGVFRNDDTLCLPKTDIEALLTDAIPTHVFPLVSDGSSGGGGGDAPQESIYVGDAEHSELFSAGATPVTVTNYTFWIGSTQPFVGVHIEFNPNYVQLGRAIQANGFSTTYNISGVSDLQFYDPSGTLDTFYLTSDTTRIDVGGGKILPFCQDGDLRWVPPLTWGNAGDGAGWWDGKYVMQIGTPLYLDLNNVAIKRVTLIYA